MESPVAFSEKPPQDHAQQTSLRTILFTDIAGSTDLKHRLGDSRAVTLIEKHHKAVRDELKKFESGREVSTAGDSFLLVFDRPSEAVRFSVSLHKALGELSRATGEEVADRIGIHVGEVVITSAGAGKGHDYYGIQVDVCARVMSLANPGQTLLTRFAYDNAKQVMRGRTDGGANWKWKSHGLFQIKGVAEPVEICEVSDGRTTIAAPSSSDKAKRVGAGEETAHLQRPPPPPPPVPAPAPVMATQAAIPRVQEDPMPRAVSTPASKKVQSQRNDPIPQPKKKIKVVISAAALFALFDRALNGVLGERAGLVRGNKAFLFALSGFWGAAIGAAAAELVPRVSAQEFVNSGLWTGVAAIGLTLGLWLTNGYYMRRNEFPWSVVARVVGAGAVAGLIAGGAAEWIYAGDAGVQYWREILFRPTCWGIMGALLGLSLRRYLPNFSGPRALSGGAMGGAAGGFAFLFTAIFFPQGLGRIVGFAVMGGSFGLGLIAAESLFREALLEVRWAQNETTTIPLGARPVRIGGGDDHVSISGLPESAISISLQEGRVRCAVKATGQTSELKDGSSIKVGNVELVVRAKTSKA